MGVSPLTGKLKAPYYGMTAIREHMLSCVHQVSRAILVFLLTLTTLSI